MYKPTLIDISNSESQEQNCFYAVLFGLGPAKEINFSTFSLIWVHFKTVYYFSQPIFSILSYLNMRYTI